MAATAAQIRNRPILVTLPGTGLVIECCCPDPLPLIASGLLPLETYSAVLETIQQWNKESNDQSTTQIGTEVSTYMTAHPNVWASLMDRWVCAAATAPRVVLTEQEALDHPETLWVDELDYATKLEIYAKTNIKLRKSPRVEAAVKDFRRLSPERVGAGSDGAALRGAPVGVAEDSGSVSGAGL